MNTKSRAGMMAALVIVVAIFEVLSYAGVSAWITLPAEAIAVTPVMVLGGWFANGRKWI